MPSTTATTAPTVAAAPYTSATPQQAEQFVVTLANDVRNAEQTLRQDIVQLMGYVQYQWEHLLGIGNAAPTTSSNSVAPPASNGLGSGSPTSDSENGWGVGGGSPTTGHGLGIPPAPSANNAASNVKTMSMLSGSGSGSGSSGSGSGSGSSSSGSGSSSSGSGSNSSGSGTGSSGSGSSGSGSGWATISGVVFQDSNNDGREDDGESGLPGIAVQLTNLSGQVLLSTTTNASGGYQFLAD